MRRARIEAFERSGVTTSEPAEWREVRKRNRLLKQESEVIRRAAAYLSRCPAPPVHDDLCVSIDADGHEHHQFAADRPNQLWLTDIQCRRRHYRSYVGLETMPMSAKIMQANDR